VVTGSATIRGREAITLSCAHPRTIELSADRPDFAIELAVDRETGVIVRLTETIAGDVTRDAEVVDLAPDAPLQPSTFDFVFPTGTTMLY
jgi:outer membrane lipoprotein-sorting protein